MLQEVNRVEGINMADTPLNPQMVLLWWKEKKRKRCIWGEKFHIKRCNWIVFLCDLENVTYVLWKGLPDLYE